MTMFNCKDMSPLTIDIVKLIRAESKVFAPPPDANGEALPTDHHQMLKLAIYPISEAYGYQALKMSLECGLVCAASDALGIFCSIQCYYAQIVSEIFHQSTFEIDRIEVPLILGVKLRELKEDLFGLKLKESDVVGDRFKLAIGMLRLLNERDRIDFQYIES